MIFTQETPQAHFDRFAPHYDKQVSDKKAKYGAADHVFESVINFLKHQPEATILDFGCGTGLLAEKIKEAFPDVKIIGMDISMLMLEKAEKKDVYNSLHCHDIQKSITSFPDNSFDLIVSSGVFDYFPDLDSPIKELTRIAKEGAPLNITTYDSFSFIGKIKENLLASLYTLLSFERPPGTIHYSHSSDTISSAFKRAGAISKITDRFAGYYNLGYPVTYNLVQGRKKISSYPQSSHGLPYG